MPPHPSPLPRWHQALSQALSQHPTQTTLQLATTSEPPTATASHNALDGTGSSQPQPRVRSHVFRGFVEHLPRGVGLPAGFLDPGAAASGSVGGGGGAEVPVSPGVGKVPGPIPGGGGGGKGVAVAAGTPVPTTFPLILSTTDIRTPKVTQLLANPTTELAWWIEGAKQQFRIMGRVRVVPSPRWTLDGPFTPSKFSSSSSSMELDLGSSRRSSPTRSGSTGGGGTASSTTTVAEQRIAATTSHLSHSPSHSYSHSHSHSHSHSRPQPLSSTSTSKSPLMSPVEWHDAHSTLETTAFWERTRHETFRALSAHMRASWCRPVPGSPLALHGGPEAARRWVVRLEEPAPSEEGGDEGEGEKDGEEGKGERRRGRELWEEALKNFALVVVEPFEVDFVDLGVVPNRRWRFWVESPGGVWKEEELVP